MTLRQKCVAAFVATAVLGASGLMLSAQAPQAVGTWAPAGELAESQSGGPAVALEDGRTLIVGGSGADGAPTDRVVIVNPWDNSFFVAGRLLAARVGHTATLLADGRVFVTGGRVDGALVADLELFNVETGASEIVGALAQARAGHAAARLADGTVLIVGGVTVDGAVVATAESFDPATSSTVPLSSGLQSPRAGASATPLVDGRVLVAGGYDGTTDLSSAEIYHPATQTFSLLDTELRVARSGHTAVLLPNNNSVLVAGGWSNGVPQTAADLFLPAEFPDPYSYGTGSFAATAAMSGARVGAVGGPGHAEGFAFVAGGGSQSQERYRFATIRTDKDDYAPGERAVISGTGWQPGEDVTLVFQEDPAVHDDYVLTVTADAAGDIYWDQWAPEQHDLNVRFYLMARDSVSRAQVTFTDGNPQTLTLSPSSLTVVPGINAAYQASVASGGNTTACTVTFSVTTGLHASMGASFDNNPAQVSNQNFFRTLSLTTTSSTPAGTYNFTVRARRGENCQGNGDLFASGTLVVTAANNAPHVGAENTPVTVDEGQTAANTGTYGDANAADSVTITASVGTITKTGTSSGTWSWSLDTNDGPDDSTTVTITADDNNGGVSTTVFQLTVNNVVPTVNAAEDRTIDEGSPFAQSGSFTDLGTADTWTATVDYGDGSGTTPLALNPDKTFDLAHAYGDNGTFTVTVTVTDDDGGVGTDTVTVTVRNVVPTVAAGTDRTIDEGSSFGQTGSFTDPGTADTWTGTVDYGDGSGSTALLLNPDKTFSLAHTYGDNGTFTVTVTVTDDDSGVGTDTVTVTVRNVVPTVDAGTDRTIDEGSSFGQTGSFTDPGTADTWTATVDYGDGSGSTALLLNPDKTFSLAHTYGDNGTFTVTVTVTDDDGGVGTDTVTVTVRNVVPTVNAGADATIDEGTSFAQTGSFTDPGTADTWTATVNYGDGSGTTPLALNPDKTFSLAHAYGDNGTFTVTVTVTDDDGGVGTDTATVTVRNVVPTVAAGTDRTIDEGSSFGQTGSFTDPGTADTWTATVDYGDGSGTTPLALNPDKTFSLTHAYGDNGTFTVTVTVTDDDGGVGVDSVSVTVNNIAPVVTSSTFTFNPYTGAASAGISFSDPGWLDTVSPSFSWGGPLTAGLPAVSGPGSAPAVTGTFTSSYTFAPGCITGEISAVLKDDDLGQASYTLANANALQVYRVAFLAPLKDGVRNVVKLGNVIPVKLSILDCHGSPVTDKTLSISVVAGIFSSADVEGGAEVIPTSVSAADSTGLMRLADNHYMYNLATKGLSTGLPYTIIIRAGAQLVATAVVEAKK